MHRLDKLSQSKRHFKKAALGQMQVQLLGYLTTKALGPKIKVVKYC